MKDPVLYVEQTSAELERMVLAMEDGMTDIADEYLAGFYVDDNMLKMNTMNLELVNQSDRVFDEAYEAFLAGFLLFLGKKIIDGAVLTMADLSARGIAPVGDEPRLVAKMIGFENGQVTRGGFLWNVGRMGILRQRFHDYVMKAVGAGQKFSLFLRNAKPMFKSTKRKTSLFADFYRRYAFDSVNQTMNTVSNYIAEVRGLDRFLYKGGLVKDSRQFCRDHAGGIYTRADAKEFDKQHWRGKIEGVPFLVAVGGYHCIHHIQWINDKTE